jgi:AraC-like DNA-binding protein
VSQTKQDRKQEIAMMEELASAFSRSSSRLSPGFAANTQMNFQQFEAILALL